MRYTRVAGAPAGGGAGSEGWIESAEFTYLGGVAANQSDVQMWANFEFNKITMPHAGSIVKIVLTGSLPRTTGELSAKITKNTSPVSSTALDVALSSGNPSEHIRETDPDTSGLGFVQGDDIGVILETTSDWNPTNSDISVNVYYILDE